MKNRKGFTLIEVLVVVAILAILAAIAVPSYVGLVDKSVDAALSTSVNNIYTFMLTQRCEDAFSDEQFFTYKRNQNSGGEEYFSRYLETEWENLNGPGDGDNTNTIGASNPLSDKSGIVNWDNPASLDGLYQRQALYITNSNTAAYTVGSPAEVNACYEGAVVIWYDAAYASNIHIYYVGSDGMQSGHHRIIRR